MNLSEAIIKTRKLIDEYSINGVVTAETNKNLKDYLYKMPDYFDMSQKEIAQIKPIRKKKEIAQNNPRNELNIDGFNIVTHETDDLNYSATEAHAYHFAVDDVATIYVESEYPADTYTILETISNTTVGEFTTYTGSFVLPEDAISVRLRFTGDYRYNIKNIALFNAKFSSESRIPSYEPYSLYTMPSDFFQLSKVIQKGNDPNLYRTVPDYHWETPNVMALPYDYVGEFRIEYNAMPTTIDSDTLSTYEFEVDVEAQEAMPFFVAAMCFQPDPESKVIFTQLFQIYQGKLSNLDPDTGARASRVKNSMFQYPRASKLIDTLRRR